MRNTWFLALWMFAVGCAKHSGVEAVTLAVEEVISSTSRECKAPPTPPTFNEGGPGMVVLINVSSEPLYAEGEAVEGFTTKTECPVCTPERRRAVEERVFMAQSACRDAWSVQGDDPNVGPAESTGMIEAKVELEFYVFQCGTEAEQDVVGDFYAHVWRPGRPDDTYVLTNTVASPEPLWSRAWDGCFGTPPGETPYCGAGDVP